MRSASDVQPPLRVVWAAGSAAIAAAALLACWLLEWDFTAHRAAATGGLCACFCLRAWQRRQDAAWRLADEALHNARFRAAVERRLSRERHGG